jgi:hypothetical protein
MWGAGDFRQAVIIALFVFFGAVFSISISIAISIMMSTACQWLESRYNPKDTNHCRCSAEVSAFLSWSGVWGTWEMAALV